ncbi:MAG: hypothetical protein ABS75_01225 [Pelagibacterium sp. SCN 63-23]|jgi:hypothetical protein|nr:MAG: hypothetical protein ABS75_01225 [Pelagibacterium sp. SCN 63-23]
MSDNSNLQPGLSRLHRLATARGLEAIEAASPALHVDGVAFIHLLDPTTAVLQCPVDQKALLLDISPDIYFETDHYVGQDAMLIRLDRISDEELSLRLHDAWTFRAPDHLKTGKH